MRKYVVGYLNFFDNELLLEVVEANSAFEAAVDYMDQDPPTETTNLEDFQVELFAQDTIINVLDITPKYNKQFNPSTQLRMQVSKELSGQIAMH